MNKLDLFKQVDGFNGTVMGNTPERQYPSIYLSSEQHTSSDM